MGFFVKACIQALREVPAVNAEIDGDDIVYKNYYHIGVAVSTDRGLVVPVVREADRMSLAEIEMAIADFGRRAREGKLSIEEMQGGTFSITNGGVFGSLLSTPILNAPQSGILGMHRIEERAIVKNGQIVARPMMNLALELRPPHRRRPRGRDLPGAREGVPGGPAAVPAGGVRGTTHVESTDDADRSPLVAGVRMASSILRIICRRICTRYLREHEAMISIVTGDLLEGSLPRAKLRAVQKWLAAHREEVAYVWQEIRAHALPGGMIGKAEEDYRIRASRSCATRSCASPSMTAFPASTISRDLIARGSGFAPLKDEAYFRTVAVGEYGHTFGWNLDDLVERDRLLP